MATFAYRAIDEEGHIQNGNIDAVNGVDLELRLKRMGLDLIKFDSIKKSALFGGPRITRKELITFCFHLDQLMRAGVPISSSIFSAASLAPPWAGPQRQAMPAAIHANGLAPDEPANRTVEVDAFCSWSACSIKMRSSARETTGLIV